MKGGIFVEAHKNWLKFVITGKAADYLKFVESCKKNDIREENTNGFYNRCSGYKGNDSGGE